MKCKSLFTEIEFQSRLLWKMRYCEIKNASWLGSSFLWISGELDTIFKRKFTPWCHVVFIGREENQSSSCDIGSDIDIFQGIECLFFLYYIKMKSYKFDLALQRCVHIYDFIHGKFKGDTSIWRCRWSGKIANHLSERRSILWSGVPHTIHL